MRSIKTTLLLASLALGALPSCGGNTAPAVKCAADAVAPVVARIEQAVEQKDYIQLAQIAVEVGPELYACATQAKADQVKAARAPKPPAPAPAPASSGSGSGSAK